MTRCNIIGTLIVMTLVLGIVGCQMFDNSPTEVAAPADGVNVLTDFLWASRSNPDSFK